jgi:hypothetical protein
MPSFSGEYFGHLEGGAHLLADLCLDGFAEYRQASHVLKVFLLLREVGA